MQQLAVVAAIGACRFALSASAQSATANEVAVKAAILFNFAKFVEWPALAAGAPIAVCVVGDNRIADALVPKPYAGLGELAHPLPQCRQRIFSGRIVDR